MEIIYRSAYNLVMIVGGNEVEKLADLARIKLSDNEVEGLVSDFQKILSYFEELKDIDTRNVEPVSGGSFLLNVHRHDEDGLKTDAEREDLVKAFPEKEGEYLKVPAVFG